MARILQITDGTNTLDFYDGNLILAADGWSTITSNEKVWETIELIGDTTDGTIRSTKIFIDDMAEQARIYHLDQKTADAVWFQWNADGETLKQALVYEIQSEILSHEILSSPLLGSNVALLRVVIQRHPNYEPTSYTNTSTSNVSTLGGQWSIGSAAGNSPERIARINITKSTAGTEQQIWLGIRPTYEGFSSFESLWEAEDGAIGDSSVADGSASGGYYRTMDLTDDTNSGWRGSISISNVIGDTNYDHFIGKYHVLMRARVGESGTVALVELAQNWQGSISQTGITVIDDVTTWTLFSMGTISLPPYGDRGNIASSNADFDDCGFGVIANTSQTGTRTLDIDCFVLIPAEYELTVLGADIDTSNDLDVYRDPDEGLYGIGVSTWTQGGLQISGDNWYYPVGGGLLVCAAQADTGHTLSKTLDFSIYLYPRYKSYSE